MVPEWLTQAQRDSATCILLDATMTILGVDPNAQAAEPTYRRKMLGGVAEIRIPMSTRSTGSVVFTADIRPDGSYRLTTNGRKTDWCEARRLEDERAERVEYELLRAETDAELDAQLDPLDDAWWARYWRLLEKPRDTLTVPEQAWLAAAKERLRN